MLFVPVRTLLQRVLERSHPPCIKTLCSLAIVQLRNLIFEFLFPIIRNLSRSSCAFQLENGQRPLPASKIPRIFKKYPLILEKINPKIRFSRKSPKALWKPYKRPFPLKNNSLSHSHPTVPGYTRGEHLRYRDALWINFHQGYHDS